MDDRIEAAYNRICKGMQLDTRDIQKVFNAGREAIANGENLEVAISSCVETIREK